MRHLPDALILTGALVIPAGVALVHLAAGVVAGGLVLMVLGVVYAIRSHHGRAG